MTPFDFEFCLFSVDPGFVSEAVDAGIHSIIVDWENKGKMQRQKDFDTQVNHHTTYDLKTVRAATQGNVICRINAIGPHTEKEIDDAIRFGANEVLIPMVRCVEEVRNVLDYVKGKIGIGILIETNEAVACADKLCTLPLQRIYVGLNDLAIENKSRNIFIPIANGLLDDLKRSISLPFGFGGMTLPEQGHPIPAKLLIAEIVRLGCHFSFLRRSFLSDIKDKNLSWEMSRLRETIQFARNRTYPQIEADHHELVGKIHCLELSHAKLI